MTNQTTLIIGANSEIAKALALQIIKDNNSTANTKLIVITRCADFYLQAQFSKTKVITVDNYQEASIISAIQEIQMEGEKEQTSIINQVFICHGLLHSDQFMPEKRLQEFCADTFTQILTANTITPMLWLKNLVPVLKGKQACKVVVFSARVGSISDNKIGGWYSYRASKAAINMLLKTTAVELSRSAKNIKLISFHPGTTDTPLSKPFQKNVPENKLFRSEFVATQLLQIVKQAELDNEASFVDWQGKKIPW